MRDQRRSTATNDEPMDADALRLTLGRRIRAARTAEGLSQQAVADAMTARGFSWRQTTVAKSEGADRPILFTEIVALSAILKRDLDYFLSGRNALDEAADRIQNRLTAAKAAYESHWMMMGHAKEELKRAQTLEKMVSGLLDYTRTLDRPALQDVLMSLAESGGLKIPDVVNLLMNAGVPGPELASIDNAAIRAAVASSVGSEALVSVLAVQRHTQQEIKEVLETFRTELTAPSYALDAVRGTSVYQESVARALFASLVEYLDARPEAIS